MAGIELLSFQQNAADKLVSGALRYFADGADKVGGRQVPYIGQLKAVTGAGKTPVLANVVGRLGSAIVLWTTKYGSVVDQTVNNLRAGGKYNHLLGEGYIEVADFADVINAPQRFTAMLERKDGLTVLVSTVAAWRSSEKDERLNVHRVGADFGDKSRWDMLKQDRSRPIWIVYDEAHNSTSEQVEQLDDLDPTGFFVASASAIKGELNRYLSMLGDQKSERIASIKTGDVVEAQLLKTTLRLEDFDSPTFDVLEAAVERRKRLDKQLITQGVSLTPKVIYVVEDSKDRPVEIWRTLVNRCAIDSTNIAICTNTRELPKGAESVASIDQLSDKYTHIIFNKKLQEGWDDPSVYVCYFDGRTNSATRIQQVIGRAMRQPTARHFDDDDLNTAYFYLNCSSEKLEEIIDDLREDLRGQADQNDPDPYNLSSSRTTPPKIAIKPEWAGGLSVSKLNLQLPQKNGLSKLIESKLFEFGPGDLRAPGKAIVNIMSVATGEVKTNEKDLLEEMKVRCGSYLHDQIKVMSKNAANAVHLNVFDNDALDKWACYTSRALAYYHGLAEQVVNHYQSVVALEEHLDPAEATYTVGDYQPSNFSNREFHNAAHPCYDLNSFNPDEMEVAKALDKFDGYVWARNKSRRDYFIPLPVKSRSSSSFYPDFLWWVKDTVWAIDPTGEHILEEKLRSKLLSVPPPLRIALMTRGEISTDWTKRVSDSGWTLARYKMGNTLPEHYQNLADLFDVLESES